MQKAIVTGGCGFIGSNLVDALVTSGWHVTVIDDLSNGSLEWKNVGADFLLGDFGTRGVDSVKNIKPDVVFHLAALPRVSYSVEHPLETFETNVTKTVRLIDACRGNVGRFIFSSSSSVYGGADILPTPETERKNPQSPYAQQKWIIEQVLQMYAQLYQFDCCSLRYFNVFGPRALGNSPYSTAIAAWLTAIKTGNTCRSDGDGTQSRDLCYVDNVVHANVLAALKQKRLSGDAYNVACGESTSNNAVLNVLKERYGDKVKVANAPWRAGDVMHTLADTRKIECELGYEPLVLVEEGIKRTCDWYDETYNRLPHIFK